MSVVPWFGELNEEQKFSVRMESIFMPNARTKRDSFFFAAPNRLAHYTSAESALKIIQSKRLWMRSTTCKADFREVEHGYQMLHDYFADSSKKSQFFSALDECVPSAISEAISLFDQWWANIRFNTYIASIAEHEASEDVHGRLSMWRAFGKDVSKVALVLRLGPNEAAAQNVLNVMFNPVLYLDREAAHAMLDQVAMKVKSESEFLGQLDRNVVIQWLFVMLISCVTCLKHEGFQEEREWRAIYSRKEQRPRS